MPLPPIRREVIVAVDPERAFAIFTEDIVQWWPLQSMSVLGPGSLVSIDDGALIERTLDGQEAVWGEVKEWVPGARLRFSWHPSLEPTPHTEVTVTFAPIDAGTRVTLEHAGWEALGDPAASRAEYESGWPSVLALYAKHVEADADTDDTWVALLHTPGPSAPTETSLFTDPRFAEHVAFVQRMDARGYLVAAGPFGVGDGSGMTILRLPGENRVAEVTELATTDDRSVVGGLLSVEVRPWSVMFGTAA